MLALCVAEMWCTVCEGELGQLVFWLLRNLLRAGAEKKWTVWSYGDAQGAYAFEESRREHVVGNEETRQDSCCLLIPRNKFGKCPGIRKSART